LSIYDWICFLFTKKLTYIVIKFYSLGIVTIYSPENPQNCMVGPALLARRYSKEQQTIRRRRSPFAGVAGSVAACRGLYIPSGSSDTCGVHIRGSGRQLSPSGVHFAPPALPCPALMANRRCKWVVEVHAVHVSEEADARMSASSFLSLSVSVPHPQQATGPRPYVPPAFSLAASIYIILFYTY